MVGAVENAKLVRELFPGWIARFYHDKSVPAAVLEELTALGAELVDCSDAGIEGSQAGMYWRFLVAEGELDAYAVRDVDARLMERDVAAVNEWLVSGKDYHVIRDHPEHSRFPMWTMLWGGRTPIHNIRELIVNHADTHVFFNDMHFVNSYVWPLIKGSVFEHDCWSCTTLGGKCVDVVRSEAGEHMGAVFDEHGEMRAGDVAILKRRMPEPAACRTYQTPK